MKNILFVLMEGSHDCAFLYRILKANGYKTFHKKIREYPKPFDDFLKESVEKTSILDINIESVSSSFIPRFIMKNDTKDILIFIYSTGGDSQPERRIKLINDLRKFHSKDEENLELDVLTHKKLFDRNINIMYFLDADDKGTNKRIEQIQDELNQTELSIIENQSFQTYPYKIDGLNIGYYIFGDEESDSGDLENVLIPLMKKDNEDIFASAESFLSINKTCQLFKDKIVYDENDNTIIKKVCGDKYYYNKSLIGTVGQLQKSGASNVVCISKGNYLNEEKILNNSVCRNIVKNLHQLIDN